VPAGIGNGDWTIEIVDSAGNINYSPMFTVTGGTGVQGAAAVTSTVVASTATSTPTLTGIPIPGQSGSSSTSGGAATKTVTTTTGSGAVATGAAVQLAGHGMAAVMGLGALVMLA
jgi:hypothetical protein